MILNGNPCCRVMII